MNADNSHEMPSFIFSENKRKTPRKIFVINDLKVKPFLIQCIITAHKRIDVSEIVCFVFFYLKDELKTFTPLNLISLLKSKISLSIFIPNFNAEIPFTSSYLALC